MTSTESAPQALMVQKSRQPLSLASRLLWPVALLVLCAGSLLATVLQSSIEQHFAELDAADLENYASTQLHHLASAGHQSHPDSHSHHQRFMLPLPPLTATMVEQATPSDFASIVPLLSQPGDTHIGPAQLIDWQYQQVPYRGAVWQSPQGERVAVVMTMTIHQQYLQKLYLTLWLSIGGCVLAAVLVGWWSIRRGLTPIRKLSGQILAVHTDALDVRLDPQQVPAELHGLVESFNQMLARLQQSFAHLTDFSADIAHELRTPLSNLITQTQVGLSKARSLEQYQDLLYSNLEEQERLSRMVSDMLWLAKTDHGLIELSTKPVALYPLCQQLIDYFDVLADSRSIQLKLCGSDQQAQADKTMLQRAISNLLSNAIRYADVGSTVQVRLSMQPALEQQPAHCQIAVINQGPAIAPAQQARLFERFYRADPARQRIAQDGAGLGLAIVHSIVALHHGRISVQCAEGQTTFCLALPAAMTLDNRPADA